MSRPDPTQIRIPDHLRPADGRFGCGPSRLHPGALGALQAAERSGILGTSHRQAPVRQLVGSVRARMAELFALPDGWEVVLGNGGSTAFWDIATLGLIERRSHHLVFGEFSSKFAEASAGAPHLEAPGVSRAPAGDHPDLPTAAELDGCDLLALTHNETSTGVAMPVERPGGADGVLVCVDATSGAGGLPWRPSDADVYYFGPQKCFAGDGGLWLALCSPRAVERIGRIAASGRWTPASLSLPIALDNSRLDQTYNTPALGTLVMLDHQLGWMLGQGGLAGCIARSAASAAVLYGWATAREWAEPFVTDPAKRSTVVGTVDLAGVDAGTVSSVLRANGIVDTDAYRKLGRNQLRIGMFPVTPASDVERLTASIDHVVERLTG